MPQKNRTVKGVLGGLVGLVALSAVAGVLVTATVTPALAVAGVAGSHALSLFDKLPTYLEVNAPMEPTTIYATDTEGNPVQLATFFDQNRVPVTYEQISPVLFDAILSSEDKTFYEHGGINLGATVKAVYDNLRGTSSRGASTISQQFVKNVLIQECEKNADPTSETYATDLEQCWLDATNATGSDGIERKLQEMRYAIQIEKDYSKNDILLGYLNIANFGGQTYGIEAAANYYFNTTSAELTVAQAATLAGMVQNPNTLRIDKPAGSWTDKEGVAHNSADDGYASTLTRRNYVIKRMLVDGKITQEQFDEAMATPIVPDIHASTQGCAAAGRNAYFCQYVRTVIENDEAFGETRQERLNNLKRGGLEIYTTLDFRIQDAGNAAMERYVVPTMDRIQLGAAGVSIETSTGRILAMVQNTTFTETTNPAPGSTGLVYASDKTHGGSIGFPVGSTYKLFTLVDWLEKGHSVNEVLNGTTRTFTKYTCNGETYTNSTLINNFGKNGGRTGTVRDFTRTSLNTGYLAMAEKLDICEINAVADRMGVKLGSGGKVTDKFALYDVLGSKNIAPLDIAGAYATVANKGIYCTPRAIDKVIKQDGTEMPLPEASCEQVISPEVAATAAYALQGVMTGGTGSASNTNDGTPLIGKTGTHQSSQTMMVESSTNVATAIWVGNVEGTESLYNKSSNGTQLALLRHKLAPAMQRAANAAYGGDRFPAPDKNLTRQVYTDLPNVVGMTIEEATSTLDDAGFSVSVGAPVDSDAATNIVAAQSPGAGKVAGGATITISPSNGQGATVPDVLGNRANQAQGKLMNAGFTNINWAGECSDPDAEVTGTNPAPGTATNRGTTVTVACSS